MIDTCPHCGQRMLMRHGVLLSPRRADIFDMIERASLRGISNEVLADVFFPNKPSRAARRLLAVHVSQINDCLEATGYFISGDRDGRYTVLKRKLQEVA